MGGEGGEFLSLGKVIEFHYTSKDMVMNHMNMCTEIIYRCSYADMHKHKNIGIQTLSLSLEIKVYNFLPLFMSPPYSQ